jgi:hypothetical protein
MSRYRLHVGDNSEATEFTVKGRIPAKALRELVAAAGLTLANQNGRYGTLTDGRKVVAFTEPWGRAYYGRGAERNERFYGKEGR